MTVRDALRRLLGGDGLPDGFAGRLEPDERVLAVAPTADGAHLVVTSWGLWLPPTGSDAADGDRPGPRRVGWHLVSRATWKNGVLTVVEAVEEEIVAEAAVLLSDRPARRFRLVEPGTLPETVHARVEGSIRSRHHRDFSGGDLSGGDLSGGGAWFVQRRVPGRDGAVLQVRPDPGTDRAVAAQVAADVARSLGAQ